MCLVIDLQSSASSSILVTIHLKYSYLIDFEDNKNNHNDRVGKISKILLNYMIHISHKCKAKDFKKLNAHLVSVSNLFKIRHG